MFFKMVVKWLLCNVEELILSHYNDPESQKSSDLFYHKHFDQIT